VEYEGLGVEFARRGARMEEQIAVLRELWAHDSIDYRGEFHRIDRAGILPRPERGSIPIWIGTFGTDRRALERIGRGADGWNPLLKPDEQLEAAKRIVAEAAEKAGRDPMTIGLEGRIRVVPDDNALSILRQAEAWEAAGASYVAIDTLHCSLTAEEHIARI